MINTMKKMQVYTLLLQQGKYYVGTTMNMARRYNQHLKGVATKWTEIYKPIQLLEKIPGNEFIELIKTKELMTQHGIDNVRGGPFTQVELSAEDKRFLTKEILSSKGACFQCGLPGHLIRQCPKNSINSFTSPPIPKLPLDIVYLDAPIPKLPLDDKLPLDMDIVSSDVYDLTTITTLWLTLSNGGYKKENEVLFHGQPQGLMDKYIQAGAMLFYRNTKHDLWNFGGYVNKVEELPKKKTRQFKLILQNSDKKLTFKNKLEALTNYKIPIPKGLWQLAGIINHPAS